MKLDFYQTFAYLADAHPSSWPAGPSGCDPVLAGRTVDLSFEQCEAALEVGFDGLTFAEHHYSPKQLSPNPIIYAGVAAKRWAGVQIGVFGTDLPINNPVRVAEEYAQLDVLAAHDIQSDRPEAFADVVSDFVRRGMNFLVNETDYLINP